MLRCSGCKLDKPSSEFNMCTTAPHRDYTRGYCIPCHRANAIKFRKNTCQIQDCTTKAVAMWSGIYRCGKHGRELAIANGKRCSVEACDKAFVASVSGKDYCAGHRKRWVTHGDTFPDIPLGHKLPENWEDKESCVYVLSDSNCQPIYIGSSFGDTGRERLSWHLSNQPWADEIVYQSVYSTHATRGEAYEQESSLIAQWRLTGYSLYNKT